MDALIERTIEFVKSELQNAEGAELALAEMDQKLYF